LEQAWRAWAFREDSSIANVFTISLPALRERQDDIVLIARQCLAESGRRRQREGSFAVLADALRAHRWPGNVRELRNVIERAAIAQRRRTDGSAGASVIQKRSAADADSVGEIQDPAARGSRLAARGT